MLHPSALPTRASTYLLRPLGLGMVVQKGALKDRAHNGQALPCLELGGQREQLWMCHVLVLVHTHQHQQLWPEEGARSHDPSTTYPTAINSYARTPYAGEFTNHTTSILLSTCTPTTHPSTYTSIHPFP